MKQNLILLVLINTLNARSLFSPTTNEYIRFRKHHIADATEPNSTPALAEKNFFNPPTNASTEPAQTTLSPQPTSELDQIFNFTQATCAWDIDRLHAEITMLTAKNNELSSTLELCKQQKFTAETALDDYRKRTERLEADLTNQSKLNESIAKDRQDIQQKIATLMASQIKTCNEGVQENKQLLEKIRTLEFSQQTLTQELKVITEKNQELNELIQRCKVKKRQFKKEALRTTELERQLTELQQKDAQELANYRTKIESLEHELAGKQQVCGTEKEVLQKKMDDLTATHAQVLNNLEQENKTIQEKLQQIIIQEHVAHLETEALAAKNKEISGVLEHCKERKRQLKDNALRMIELEHQLKELTTKNNDPVKSAA